MVIVGQTGTGKSYFSINFLIPLLVNEAVKSRKFSIIYCSSFIPTGNPEFRNLCLGNIGTPETITAWKPFYWLPISDEQKALKDISTIIRYNHPMVLIVEETQMIFTDPVLNSNAGKEIRYLATVGRNVGQSAILITQRPSLISKTLLSQAACIISFRMTHKTDLAHLATILEPDELETISALKNRQFLLKEMGESMNTSFFEPMDEEHMIKLKKIPNNSVKNRQNEIMAG